MEKLLLGIDIGTSACKVAVFDLDGHVIVQANKAYSVYYPEKDFVEQDAEEWWRAVCEATKECINCSNINPEQIAGIGIDGQSWAALPVDEEGKTLHNAIIWMDRRSTKQCREVIEEIGEEQIFDVSGNPFEATYTTPKILWLKENKPDIFNKTYKFLQSNSYIAFKLTGAMTQDLSQGYGLHCFNMETGQWNSELCKRLGIPAEKLPDIVACDKIVGTVTDDASKQTGLAAGTPVVAGGLDAACGALGAGVIEFGQTQEQGGQAGGMSICIDKPIGHKKLILGFHVIPNAWLLQGGTVGGGSLKWFRNEFGEYEKYLEEQKGENSFDALVNKAKAIKPGADGVIYLPYMAGERSPIWDKHAKGVFYGLGYDKTKGHMVRAILEGTAYALEHNLQTAKEVNAEVNELIAIGGAANSLIWTQIKSDVTGKKIKVPTSDTATTLGAALLAGVGTGLYKDYREAVQRTIKITRVYEPNMEAHKIYNKYYPIYLEIYENLKNTFIKSEA